MKPFLTVLFVFGLCAATAAQNDSKVKQIKARLSTQKMSVDFDGLPLEDALNVFRSATGLNIIMDPSARAEHAADPITLKLKQLSVRSILRIMLVDKGLTLVYRQGVLVVVPKEYFSKRLVTKVYDVKDLLTTIRNFPGPKVELVPPDSSGGMALTGAVFSFGDEDDPPDIEDFLTGLILQSTGGDTWDENENASLEVVNNLLVITQSKRVHQEVAAMLRMLSQFK